MTASKCSAQARRDHRGGPGLVYNRGMRKIIAIIAIVLGLALGSCQGPSHPQEVDPHTLTCNNICNSNLECTAGDILKRCPFCSFGTCSNVSPLQPTSDAGVDAR